MPSYKKLYHKTFNAITDAQDLIEKASAILVKAQQECEEIVMDSGYDPVIVVNKDNDN